MSRRTVHMCLDIRGALAWPDRKLAGMFTDKATGKPAPAWAVRDELLDHVAKGHRVFPMCKCEGFSFETGCPGHEEPETGTAAMDRGILPTADPAVSPFATKNEAPKQEDPQIGAKLAARSELAEARGAYAAAERAMNTARGRLSKARAAARKLGLLDAQERS